jgi:hypothetical protein
MNSAETESATEQDQDSTPRATWQFSLRSLFVLTTVASIGLAIGVHYGGFTVVALAAGLILAGALLSADWLIRPQNRRVLAFITASAWIVIGSGIVMLGVEAFVTTNALGKQELGWPVGAVLVAGGLDPAMSSPHVGETDDRAHQAAGQSSPSTSAAFPAHRGSCSRSIALKPSWDAEAGPVPT